jgi:hypothetical protein
MLWGPFNLLVLSISYLREVDGMDMDFIYLEIYTSTPDHS